MPRRRLLTLLPGLLLPLEGCGDMCGNDPLQAQASPSGRREAIVFLRGCGATTGFSTQVSVLKKGEGESGPGNVFISDDEHGTAAPDARPWVEVRWLAVDRLLIRYDGGLQVVKREARRDGVSIEYSVRPASGSAGQAAGPASTP
jgi:hypothetical protein